MQYTLAYPDVAGNVQDVANAVGVISSGYLSYSYGLDLSFSYIADKVYNSHPVIAAMFPIYSFMGEGHAVLIIGWENRSGTDLIRYYDPTQPGNAYTCSYNLFCNGSNCYLYNYQYQASAYKN